MRGFPVDEIKKKKSPVFDDIPANRLDLWKVNEPIAQSLPYASCRSRYLRWIVMLCWEEYKIHMTWLTLAN
jgi:hypothetical protein